MKDYQLNVTIQEHLSDFQKAILNDYWDQEMKITTKEIIHKYNINVAELKTLIRNDSIAMLRCKCRSCDTIHEIKITSRANFSYKVNNPICSSCSDNLIKNHKENLLKIKLKKLYIERKEKAYYIDQEELWNKKKEDSLKWQSWLNLEDDDILALREIYKDNFIKGPKNFYLEHLPIKLRMYLKLFNSLGLLHLIYSFNNPRMIDEILLNEAVFPNLYLARKVNHDLSIHFKVNENINSPTAPSYRNTIKFDVTRILESNRSYACGLWELPDGSMNLKITPVDQLVRRPEEIE